MKDITKFQAIVLGVLALSAVVATILFATAGKGDPNTQVGTGGTVQLWGTLNKRSVDTVLSVLMQENEGFSVKYTQIPEDQFDRTLVESIASGIGPDAIILPNDLIIRQLDKVFILPYENFSERTFKDVFTEGSEIFFAGTGSVGLPIGVDPLVMYWNRDRFTNKGIIAPPRDWESFFSFANNVTERNNGVITAPAVAFGAYQNVHNAKAILSMLMMQAGNPLETVGAGGIQATLDWDFGTKPIPAQAALVFYTDFSDPLKAIYSWNRSLPEDRDMFTRGDLALYFGTASELPVIRAQNPNLNFDVAVVPQPLAGSVKQTYGTFYTVVPLKSSKNINGAFTVMYTISSDRAAGLFTSYGLLQPVRRSILSVRPTDAFQGTFYDSAFIARSWRDPNPAQSNIVFQRLVEDVVTGRSSVGTAISVAQDNLDALYGN